MFVLPKFISKSMTRLRFNKLLHSKSKFGHICYFSSKSITETRAFVPFEEVETKRRNEARKSLLVQVHSEQSFSELYSYCHNFGDVSSIHHYCNSGDEHFMLVEFKSEASLRHILQKGTAHQSEADATPLQTPFLWFRAAVNKTPAPPLCKGETLAAVNGTENVDFDKLFNDMQHCRDVSEQIQMLFDRSVLNDVSIRLRYMVARQLEVVFGSLYSGVAVRPFGSSVNGFGRRGADLDLVLTNTLAPEQTDKHLRLVFQEKGCEGAPGGGSGVGARWPLRHVQLAAEVVALRVPGASAVRAILPARVPILKFHHDYARTHCDLSLFNTSGVYMSDLLYLMGGADARVRPLVFSVRQWAQSVGLTNPHPGKWITNFPLTLMVVFYMQQDAGAGSLPSLKFLVENADDADKRVTEEKIDCTFLRDLNRVTLPCSNRQATLEELLKGFFEFYAQFPFQDRAICIYEGAPIRKFINAPLLIMNPLEKGLNVTKNVSYDELERLKTEIRNAAWKLEAGRESESWGLLDLMNRELKSNYKKHLRSGNKQRLVQMSNIFKEETESETEKEVHSEKDKHDSHNSSLNNSIGADDSKELKNRDSGIKYKNEQIRNIVRRIKRNKIY